MPAAKLARVHGGSRSSSTGDRDRYGPLQLSLISTSLLVMLHVPPVVLLGAPMYCWMCLCVHVCLYQTCDKWFCTIGILRVHAIVYCCFGFGKHSGMPARVLTIWSKWKIMSSSWLGHPTHSCIPMHDLRMSMYVNSSLEWPLSPRASVTCCIRGSPARR